MCDCDCEIDAFHFNIQHTFEIIEKRNIVCALYAKWYTVCGAVWAVGVSKRETESEKWELCGCCLSVHGKSFT